MIIFKLWDDDFIFLIVSHSIYLLFWSDNGGFRLAAVCYICHTK